ncbi:MAG TPA: hypothetical protein PKK61_04645 [Defluviitaleaceae bacterium]|nr:hypothetical protein [Defluviitaleaceae bacterium]
MIKKLNHSILIITLIIVFGIVIGTGEVMGVAPGSNQDPLVSKSYVDSRIEAVMDLIGKLSSNNDTSTSDSLMTYEVVEVAAGKSLIGYQGTEIILRGGKGLAITAPLGGLQDMTEGTDILSGQDIPKYHLIIIPRDDGRGIYVESDAVFMVKGKYEIMPLD